MQLASADDRAAADLFTQIVLDGVRGMKQRKSR
jgi:hypothetical protein